MGDATNVDLSNIRIVTKIEGHDDTEWSMALFLQGYAKAC